MLLRLLSAAEIDFLAAGPALRTAYTRANARLGFSVIT